MTKYIGPGAILELTAPSAVSSDDVLKVGQIIGVVVADADNGDPMQLAVQGVFELACKSADVVSEGDLLYWDDGNSEFTTTSSSNELAGVAVGASGSGNTTVKIRLSGTPLADEPV